MSRSTNGVTQAFLDYALALSYESIPPQVIEKAKHLFLDFLGVALGGHSVESTGPVLGAVRELSGEAYGGATVVGVKEGFPPHYAALINGTLAHSMDFDDTHRDSISHPGTPIFSTLLALAETNHASGHDFLTAATVGYDVTGKLGRAHADGVHKRGFHPTATTGIFGGVAAGGRLLRLDHQTLGNALGMALSQAAGSLQFLDNGAWNKRVHVGLAAHNAIISLTMARHNVLGAAQPLEGRFGYFKLYSDDKWDADTATKGLGEEFELLNTATKPYPCCRYNHSVIDAVAELARQHSLNPQDVEQIQIELSPVGTSLVAEPEGPKRRPDSVVDGQFSVYFAAAVALLEKSYSWDSYSYLHDPVACSLMDRVQAVASPAMHALGTKVRITTKEGATLAQEVSLAKGEPENPLTWEDLVAKFQPLARAVLSNTQVEEIIHRVSELERVEDMADLAPLLRPA